MNDSLLTNLPAHQAQGANTRSEKGRPIMYEASEVIAIGEARELILGVKPIVLSVDEEGEPNRANRVDDIDETDE
jgi:hypothetical protein